MNHFAHQTAAERYTKDRPYFHPLVMERVRAFLKLGGPVPVGIDVGCGTGMSTRALTEIATVVIGADISPAMISQAPAHPRIRYVETAAEALPLRITAQTYAWSLETVRPFFAGPTGTFPLVEKSGISSPSRSPLSPMSENQITILEADLSRKDHADTVIELLNGYSMDPMGDGAPLSENTRRTLIPALREHPTTMIFLAWRGSEPIGLAICFRGFSTFAARPLLNIHDFYVATAGRGAGIGRQLMATVEKRAREIGCCKLTLEVLENNRRARTVYHAAGFKQAAYQPEAGGSLFYAKPL